MAGAGRVGELLGRTSQLLPGDFAAPHQVLAQGLLAIARGGEDDVAIKEEDLFTDVVPPGFEDPRDAITIDSCENLRQRRFFELAPVYKFCPCHQL